ncbi:unnamed protein product [Rotaria magnacalcarata]|uniref:Alpha/beta hydrolase n=1 Tax=Rotaria magnacalcarata TaxID=392030 RepID=A0A816L365_9BILA|nr:unnamed protein product [Rotaria magnacalcarata]CAF1964443.1 unnamed protein product [Rotaria magnacalcarata]
MLIMSNADHANNNDGIPIKKSSFIIKELVFIGVCFILLLIMIVLLLIMRNLTVQLLLLFIVSIIALILIIVVAFVEYWIELTKKNILKLIVLHFFTLELEILLSLSLTLFVGGITATILYRSNLFKFIYFLLLFAIGCIGVIVFLWLYLIDGYDMIIDVMIPSERFSNNITNDPSLNGNYSYSFVTYGSGYDERIDYGIKASIKTPTIDLSSIIKISSFNKKTFKYNESTLPFNSRIWYPTNNSGPYPIVLMVHGNHICTESSEIGYEYLGKMLASQGFIAVSIDENVLNDALPFYLT